ncbi:MAG: YckD family protein [Syntrophomonadaceae bacterium]|nr:YckD family protein [Syntrophomonadaceae bacterium]
MKTGRTLTYLLQKIINIKQVPIQKLKYPTEKGGLSITRLQKTLIASLLTFAFLTALGSPVYSAVNAGTPKQEIQLTEKQKQELAALYKDVLNKKKEIISKYVEYGVLSEETGKKIISRMEKRYEMLEQSDFIPKWGKPKHCKS